MKKALFSLAILTLVVVSILMTRTPQSVVVMSFDENDTVHYSFDSLHLVSEDSTVSLSVRFPVASNEQVTTGPALNVTIEELLYSLMFEGYTPSVPVKEQLANEFELLVQDHATINSVAPWEIQGNVDFVYNKNGVISVRFSVYQYMGGAHGMASDLYISGSRGSVLQEIPLTTLFAEPEKSELTAIAESIFRAEQEIADSIVLTDAGYTFVDDVFSLTDNFAVTADGLLFHYNPYDIASYAMGEITLVIPYEKFQPLLNDGAERFWGE